MGMERQRRLRCKRGRLPTVCPDEFHKPSRNPRTESISWFGASLDRLAQPLHGELDISRLQIAPAFDLGLISILRVPPLVRWTPSVVSALSDVLPDMTEHMPGTLSRH
jgi:hypothetical protein